MRLSSVVRAEVGMIDTDRPWTDDHRLEGVPEHPRHHDVIQVAYGAYLSYCRKNREAPSALPMWCVDVSQQVDRKAWGPEPRAFSKGTLVYVFALDKVLTPLERPVLWPPQPPPWQQSSF